MDPELPELADADAVEVVEELTDVPFNCFASCWKAAKLFGPSATALAANTMPWPQCPV